MPDSSSLVTITDYAAVTQDSTSSDPAVQNALDAALGLIQDNTGRTLVLGTYLETLYIYQNGTVYPSATPIQSVTSPAGGNSVQGAGVVVNSWWPTTAGGGGAFLAGRPAQIDLTYTGGFTATTLPVKLKRALCRTAFNILHPSQLAGLPGGVNSVHVGDVGYSAAGSQSLRTFDPLDDGILKDIKGFRNPNFRGWQIAPVPVT